MSEHGKYLKDLDELDKINDAREKATPLNLRDVRVIDLVRYREGTAVRLIPVQPKKQNIQLSWKLEYIPDRGMYESFSSYMKLLAGKIDSVSEITDEQFPDKAVRTGVTFEWDRPGTPQETVIIMENEEGEAPFRKQILGEFDQSIADLQEKTGQLEGQSLSEKAQKLSRDGSKRAASEDETPNKKKSRRNRGDDRGRRRNRRNRNSR